MPSDRKRPYHRLICAIAFVVVVSIRPTCVRAQSPGADMVEWPSYGSTIASTKYSPLSQIGKENFASLEVAWRWTTPDKEIIEANDGLRTFAFEATPIMIGGVLYVSTSLAQVAAIDAATGETLWVHDPESWKAGRPANLGFIHRGVAYWTDGEDERIFIGTHDYRLIALNAKTGEPYPDFGGGGAVDLSKGLGREIDKRLVSISSAPIVCRDVVVVGASIHDGPTQPKMPPGHIRGFDVRTGEQLWRFNSVPQIGDFGVETWEDGAWEYSGNTNVWTLMSADEELGYFYLPFGTPTNDWYGGHRKGDNLFAESLVCVDARTGRRVWHFQMVHHGLWDYDLPAAPNLVDITVGGKRIKAVAQVSKQGFCYVFDRATGEPIWPIEERPVPQTDVPGEQTSLTQPFPTKPAPFELQGLTEDDLIDFTPELRQKALEIVEPYKMGPIFTPPTIEGTLQVPFYGGGANWSGAGFDPETGTLYIPSITAVMYVPLTKPDASRSSFDYISPRRTLPGPEGLPLTKPPYGRITAIDLNTGDHKWMVAHGPGPKNHPLLKDLNLPNLGSGGRGPLVTKTLLITAQGARRSRRGRGGGRGGGGGASAKSVLRAYDKATGEEIATVELPSSPGGAAMTYMIGGRQFLVVACSGGREQPTELVAFAVPRP